jgi:hypothetical protein
MVHSVIFQRGVVLCGPMLDVDLDWMDVILVNGVNRNQKDQTISKIDFGSYRILA